jgi:hypothetical protein
MPSALADEQPKVQHDRDHASDIAARSGSPLPIARCLMPDA